MSDANAARLLPLIVADVYELAGLFRTDGEAIARAVGQTQARWQVMSAASGDPRTVPQLARRLGVTRQNVQKIADALVNEKLAAFAPNPDHRNSPYLLLTKQGRSMLDRLTTSAAGYHARLARKLAGVDVLSIQRHLRRLLTALDHTA